MAMISARACLPGRSTNKISSKRPLRINSGGRAAISFAVATTKMRARCSDSQVRKVPSTRRETPLSPSPSARAFSISSTQSTQGESPSAECSDSRRFFSASPCHLVDEIEKRSEEHTSELQSPDHLVCRLLLEKKKTTSAH